MMLRREKPFITLNRSDDQAYFLDLSAVPEINLWGGGGGRQKDFFPVGGGTFHN